MIKLLDMNSFKEMCMEDSIIVLYTRWCPICKLLLFKLEEYSELNPHVLIGKLEISNLDMNEYQIDTKNIPLTIINRKGKVVDKFQGMFEVEDLEEILSH